MNHNDDKSLLRKSRQTLDESVEKLDAQTLSRLNQARQKALSQDNQPFLLNTSWVPAGSLVALSIAIVVGSLFLSTADTTLTTDEAEFMASNEDIELIEDLEFVVWLIEQENAS